MLPVDIYVGGKEHAAMHLIYARFMCKALRDLGFLDFDEPFTKLIHQGMILGPDGNKMSKSKGNTVSPETYIEKYGSDIFRMYIMFGFDYRQGGPWDEKGIDSMVKYFTRIEKLIDTSNSLKENNYTEINNNEKELLRIKNQTIKEMTIDINDYRFNTAIARSMEFSNALNDYLKNDKINVSLFKDCVRTYVTLITPLAPHFSEELWEKLGNKGFAYQEKWQEVNDDELKGGTKNIPIQVNGKLKFLVTVDSETSNDEILKEIKANSKVQELLNSENFVKEIYVPGKIFNIVIKK